MMAPSSFGHFWGSTKGKRVHRKGLSRRERAALRGTHVDKYGHLAPEKEYDSKDKTYRTLSFAGIPGRIIPAGTIVLFHGRRYRLKKEITIPESRECLGDCVLWP